MTRYALAATALLFIAAGSGEKWTNKKCCDAKGARPWPLYNKKGVQWTHPMEAALEKARANRKLVMVFQLVGDMDKEGC
jgi:hypothetical protein